MLTIIRRHVMGNTQTTTSKVKVTLVGQRLKWSVTEYDAKSGMPFDE
jgi:hypothetical protein